MKDGVFMVNENGIVISFKEIYDEVIKTSKSITDLTTRVQGMEHNLKEQEKEQRAFRRSLQLQVFGAFLSIFVSAVVFFLFK